jgi:ABC-2 type transport system permease protein
MLFTYGVRLNANLLMDMRCRPIPIQVGLVGDKPQFRFCPWFYFPEIVPLAEHPIVRNLDLIKTDFVGSLDLIDNDIRKTVLLTSSEYTRQKNAPVLVDLAEAQQEPDRRLFSASNLPVAVLLEGQFRSAWRNRLSPEFTSQAAMGFKEVSPENKMIVIADGDIIRNRYMDDGAVLPLGYDYFTQTQYANKDLILNAVNYLVGDEGMMASRSRSIKLRKLNVMKIHEQRSLYQIINIVCPLVLLAAAGGVIVLVRRKKYCKKK